MMEQKYNETQQPIDSYTMYGNRLISCSYSFFGYPDSLESARYFFLTNSNMLNLDPSRYDSFKAFKSFVDVLNKKENTEKFKQLTADIIDEKKSKTRYSLEYHYKYNL